MAKGKGSKPPASKKALTLANVSLRRRVGNDTTTLTGDYLARLIDAMEDPKASVYPDHPLEPGEIATELYELDHIVSAMGHAMHDVYDEDPFGMAFVYVSRQLRRLGRRVYALAPPGNRKAEAYEVVTKRGQA